MGSPPFFFRSKIISFAWTIRDRAEEMTHKPPHGMRTVELTADGSSTLRMTYWDEPYHSSHGAIQESRHVFINMGLGSREPGRIRLLEMGFGTGLNALMSLMEADVRNLHLHYTALEAYPLTLDEVLSLNYISCLEAQAYEVSYREMHSTPWDSEIVLHPRFTLCKKKMDFLDFGEEMQYDLIYFDAFGARVQPQLWTVPVFRSMYRALLPGGALVTYAAKGSVRRAMQEVGFAVERLPGPPGKREMLRATRPTQAPADLPNPG